jgi:hypothetical protein
MDGLRALLILLVIFASTISASYADFELLPTRSGLMIAGTTRPQADS